ncbi:MAG: sulfite exporter TauE/SafE family protein [Turicibacter sanguinis]
MKKMTFVIEGMSCMSCKQTIEKRLKKQNGIKKVGINYEAKRLNITFDESLISIEHLKLELELLGYQLKTEKEAREDKKLILLAIILIAIIYFLFERVTPDFSGLLTSNQNLSYIILFIIGITTSFHCVSMCGSLALSQVIHHENQVKRNILYNLGRIISYTLLGGIIGLLGWFVTTDIPFFNLMPIILGIIMIVMGLSKFGLIRELKIPMFKLGRYKSKFQCQGPFILGLANGLMPCGPLQLMQLYALGTGTFIQGALAMFVFSLGTVPLMLGLGLFLNKLSAFSRTFVFKLGAILIIFLGINMTLNGLTTIGFGSTLSLQTESRIEAEMMEGKQVVEFDLGRRNYEEIVVQKGVPVELIINASQGTLNGCNRTLILKDFNLKSDLKVGENVIKFMPTKTGTFTYSCWMGMIRNTIKVID